MRPVHVSPLADADLDDLIDWLADRSPKAARRAAETLFTAIRGLSDFPETGVPIGDGVRDLTVRFGRDGFVIRHRFDGRGVTITRVFHGSQEG